MSSLNVPGSALKARRSSLSPRLASPVTASACSSENIYSTTVHSSDPCDGFGPARCSSQENIPLGKPWYLSSSAIIFNTATLSVSNPETCDQTGPVLMACPLFTPCVESARSFSPFPSLNFRKSAVMLCLYWKSAYCAIQSCPCECKTRTSSSNDSEPVRL